MNAPFAYAITQPTSSAATSRPGDDNVLDPDSFLVGDPFATLVRVGNIVALALVKSTTIEAHGVRVESVRALDLNRAAADLRHADGP